MHLEFSLQYCCGQNDGYHLRRVIHSSGEARGAAREPVELIGADSEEGRAVRRTFLSLGDFDAKRRQRKVRRNTFVHGHSCGNRVQLKSRASTIDVSGETLLNGS